uniref:Uncharacterized protein n=1 Tax=Magallana gigas TaxID=29159 RepID=A0A8W8LN17_MAGGI
MAAFMRVIDEQVRQDLRRQRIFRDRQNPLDAYDDLEIIQRYRLDRQSIISIIDLLHNICIDKHLPVSDNPEELPEDENDVVYQGPVNDGKSTRDQLIRQRFS